LKTFKPSSKKREINKEEMKIFFNPQWSETGERHRHGNLGKAANQPTKSLDQDTNLP